MRDNSDEELLAIASGTAMGYTDQARAIAEMVLRERRVQLPPDLKELRRRGAAAEAEANRRTEELEEPRSSENARALGGRLVKIGIGAFILPLFGRQFVVMRPFGWAIPIVATIVMIVGFVMIGRASEDSGGTPPRHNPRR